MTDLSIARRIADTLDSFAGLPVLEVGPGMGVLTRPLIEAGHDVTVAEIDRESVAWLQSNLPELPHERILECDFLKTDLDVLFPGDIRFCVIGNYPYNISSQIFFHILEYHDRVECISGMLQKEVAARIAAAPGKRDRGILSVLLQVWYDAEYLFTVPANVFNPPPKVESGVIRLTRNGRQSMACDGKLFKTVVKTAFGQRRKMLRGSLKGLAGPGGLHDSPLLSMRPEQLSVEQFEELTNMIADSRR